MNRAALQRGWRMPSASSLGRAARCAPSHWLSQVFRSVEKVTARGTGVHAYIVRARELGREAALAEIPEDAVHRLFCERLDLERLPAGGRLEVAFAYCPSTGKALELGVNIGRAYKEHGLRDDEIPGTVDMVGVIGDKVVVIDFKTGFKEADPMQIRFLAMVAARVLGRSRARASFLYLTEAGDMDEDIIELDAFELDQVEEEVQEIVAAVEESAKLGIDRSVAPDVVVGDWCDHCKCKENCAGQGGLIRQALQMPLDVKLTREGAGQAYQLAEHVEKLAELLKGAAKTFAKEEPLPLPDGRVLKPIPWTTTKIEMAKAIIAIEQKFGGDIAKAAVESELTKASLTRALRKLTALDPKKKITHLEEEALAAIDAAGGLKVTRTTQVRAVKP